MAILKNTTVTDNGFISPSKGSTSQRPASTTTIIQWTNTGSQSYSVLAGATPTLSNTSWTAPTGVYSVEVLVVAGGGGGAGDYGGGGGAGGVIYRSDFTVVPGNSYTVTVGAGGASITGSSTRGNSGSDSVFGSLTATGGGGGGAEAVHTGKSGGSGGGTSYSGKDVGYGVTGQGFNGGYGTIGSPGYPAGGGGGAGGPGGNAVTGTTFRGGGGGPGLNFLITGTPTWYAGGGGGGSEIFGLGGAGGIGGGGNAGSYTSAVGSYLSAVDARTTGVAGTASTGGGGGGGNGDYGTGGAGGSGVVVIRYVVLNDSTEVRGQIRYNTDLHGIETYESVKSEWVSRDPLKNFGGHNLIPASQTFYTSAASTSNVSSTTIDDPFGGQNARRVTYLASGGASINTQSTTSSIVANATYIFSVYIRKVTGNISNNIYSYQAITGGQSPITTSWSATGLSASLSTTAYTRVWATFSWTGTGTVSIVMPGYDAGNGVIADYYGPQIELASTMGPYVNTQGAGTPVPTNVNGFRTHTYTTTGISGFSPAVSGTVEVLVIGGGGGGGGDQAGGGGGAGGLVYRTDYPVIAGQQYTVTVGSGGTGNNTRGSNYDSYSTGTSGGNSQFGNIIAIGGGGGASMIVSSPSANSYAAGVNGGSGGGASVWQASTNFGRGGASVNGQGHKGGDSYQNSNGHSGGGGGGAGGVGGQGGLYLNNTGGDGGFGGRGLVIAISGAPTYYAGGGGGGCFYANAGLGGDGGGGGGSSGTSNNAGPGQGGGSSGSGGAGGAAAANTGGGGGGGGNGLGGAGGSGIVIVRYRYD
jgi:hypothetical protein